MGKLFSDQTTLRARLLFGILIMLLPLCVLAIGAFMTIRSPLNSYEQAVYEPVEKLLFLSNVQNLIHKVRVPVHNFVTTGGDSSDKSGITHLLVEISLVLEEGFEILDASGKEIDFLITAKHEWLNVSAVIEGLVEESSVEPIRHSLLPDYDIGLDRSSAMLDQLQTLILSNIKAQRLAAQRAQWQSIIYGIVILGFGILTALIGAIVLYRSVLAPVRSIEQSINRFGQGDLDIRATIQSDDELGHLAGAFNAMAARFKKIQTELDYMSIHDPLTGMYDRSKFQDLVGMEIMRSQRYNRSFSLLFIDIDNFTCVSDKYGHLVGDSVLCSVAMQVNSAIRPTDIAARYSDNSFSVLLSETPLVGARETAERIGLAIAENPLNIGDGKTLDVSVSIGMACFPEDGTDETSIFATTEQALVKARQQNTSAQFSVYYAGDNRA